MKVKDLLAALANINPDANVFVWDAGTRLNLVDVDTSFLNEEHPSFVDLNTDTDTKGDEIYVHAGWTFTQAACLALDKQGVNLTQKDTRKGFLLSADAMSKSGVRYIPGNPETKGLLTK